PGHDRMEGGRGHDVYHVDDIGDEVIETDNVPEGRSPMALDVGSTIDQVVSSIDYTLGSFVEDLDLAAGNANLRGTGNELANLLKGNAGNNELSGGAGSDT